MKTTQVASVVGLIGAGFLGVPTMAAAAPPSGEPSAQQNSMVTAIKHDPEARAQGAAEFETLVRSAMVPTQSTGVVDSSGDATVATSAQAVVPTQATASSDWLAQHDPELNPLAE